MRSLVLSTAWMLAGLVATGGLYWTFLNTPESTVWTLAASLLLVLAMYCVASVTWSGALMGWSRGWSAPALRRAATGVVAALPPFVFVGISWWLVGAAIEWVQAQAGEVGAWLMLRFGVSDARPIVSAANHAGNWLRMIVVPFAALVWLGVLLDRGWRPLVDRASVRRGFSPGRLTIATLVVLATIILPLSYATYWMPRGLPVSWAEPAFAAVKFGVMIVMAAMGLSVIASVAAPRR